MLYFNSGLGISDSAGRQKVQTGADYSEDVWIHVILVVDRPNNTVKIYANFQLVKTATLSDFYKVDGTSTVANSLDSQYAFNIGMDGLDDIATADKGTGKVDCFRGVVDDFLMFDDVLTEEEIALLASYYGK
jgi:hypothetical protein